ncbi:hypothetical protein MA16_Dca027732 [Dendrobium catenatum]|uniref:Uncharacterized protein n=1 Tax=Dendrobium catenatum TaxID=906689 RepID=A0A2I0VHU6_9ASPA|nr:hypothetical protein MA16_Dca027732 [Dendrobium catenatum]
MRPLRSNHLLALTPQSNLPQPVAVPPVICTHVPCALHAFARHTCAPALSILRLTSLPQEPVHSPTCDFALATRPIPSLRPTSGSEVLNLASFD